MRFWVCLWYFAIAAVLLIPIGAVAIDVLLPNVARWQSTAVLPCVVAIVLPSVLLSIAVAILLWNWNCPRCGDPFLGFTKMKSLSPRCFNCGASLEDVISSES